VEDLHRVAGMAHDRPSSRGGVLSGEAGYQDDYQLAGYCCQQLRM
jgi:hypothetical protein